MNFAGLTRRGGLPQKYVLTDEIREHIRRTYSSNNGIAIAKRFGLPAWKVRHWAAELGVARTKQPPWSRDDLFWLEENLHRRSWRALANHLGRTVVAVKLKAKRLGLAKCSDAHGWSQRQLAALLGVDDHYVKRLAEAGKIARQRRATERLPIQGGDICRYSRESVLRFVVEHPEDVDLRVVDRDWFFGLIAGPIRAQLWSSRVAA